MFLYNTKNALALDAFKKLAVMTTLSDKIKLKSTSATAQSVSKLKEDCPDFIWIVRDFGLAKTMTPKERLEKFLEHEVDNQRSLNSSLKDQAKNKGSEIKLRNDVRDNLASKFRSLDCFYLPVPVSDDPNGMTIEEALQKLDTLDFSTLRKPFQDSMNEVCDHIRNSIKIKSINNNTMNGKLYGEYLKLIVSNINADKTIYLHDVLSLSIRATLDEYLEEVKKVYTQKMEDAFKSSGKPVSWSDFRSTENRISQECLNTLYSKIKSGYSDEMYQEYITKFNAFKGDGKTSGASKKYYDINKSNIDKLNMELAISLWDKEMKLKATDNYAYNKPEFKNKADYNNKLDNFKNQLKRTIFDNSEFQTFWETFRAKIYLEKIDGNLQKYFSDEEEKERRAKEQKEKEKREKEQREREQREREQREREQREREQREREQREREQREREQREREQREREQREREQREREQRETENRFKSLENQIASSTRQSCGYQPYSNPLDLSDFLSTISGSSSSCGSQPRTRTSTPFSSVSGSSNDSCFSHLTSNGRPDMRFTENRIHLQNNGFPVTMSGAPDMRYTVNRMNFSSGGGGGGGGYPMTKSGRPDMRFSVNKARFGK